MAIADLLGDIVRTPQTGRKVAAIEKFEAIEAIYGELSPSLPDELESYLQYKKIRLYSHQCKAIEAMRNNEDVVLTTPTASGKSLAFNLPVFERLNSNSDATALYLYPAKALANDQLKDIRAIEGYTGIGVNAAIYDGDTPRHRRPAIRDRSRIVLSNPYEIHHILPWHHKWSRFLSGLRFVVLDEAHRYRGVFGSHIAMILRRLVRIARLYGGEPQFVLASATIANPAEFAHHLTGRKCVVVSKDGAPRGESYTLLYNPFFDGNTERSTHREAAELVVRCIAHDLQTLCFTVSRRMAELVSLQVRKELKQSNDIAAGSVSAYRAGYLPGERREIEQCLKESRLNAVVSTNALELGIDIGSLDAVVTAGFPGTMMAARQQAGRAGRRGAPSLAVLVAFQNPLDQYFMRHPESFFSKPHEHAIVNLENPHILAGHLICAAAEAPLESGEAEVHFGTHSAEILEAFGRRGLLQDTSDGWVYAGQGRATDLTGPGRGAAEEFRVVCNGHLIETMDRSQAFREAHPGAVLLHQGETFIVEDLDLGTRRIRVRKEDVDYFTEVTKSVETSIISEQKQRESGGVVISYGDVEVVERFHGYQVRHNDVTISSESLDLPPVSFTTKAVWFSIPGGIADAVVRQQRNLAGGLHGAEHAIIGMMPYHVLCDRWDIGGFSSAWYPETCAPTILVYDGCEGGTGLSEKAYELLPLILQTAHELVRDCSCEDGCPACILSPKCGNDNRPLDKEAARILLEQLSASLMNDADEVQDHERTR